jgi:hypothetical protein
MADEFPTEYAKQGMRRRLQQCMGSGVKGMGVELQQGKSAKTQLLERSRLDRARVDLLAYSTA